MSTGPGSAFWAPNNVDQAPSSANAPSPSGSDNDSLRLAPINPDSRQQHFDNYPQLPSFDDSHWFEIPSPRQNSPSTNYSSFGSSSSRNLPPPSNQQAYRQPTPPRYSEYLTEDTGSDFDPFAEFIVTPSPQPEVQDGASSRGAFVVDLTESSPQMAPSKKRKREDPGEASSFAQRVKKNTRPATPNLSQQSVEVVDLEDVEDKRDYEDFQAKQQAEAIKKQNEEDANKPEKLSEITCVICLDSPTDLTVTHCGHLFCGECLHSALHAGDKKCCPVCRATINPGKAGQKTSKTGVFVLEMKLMTANRRGKLPAK